MATEDELTKNGGAMKKGLTAGGGMLLGMLVGIIFGHLALGMVFGLLFGAAVSARRSRDADQADKSN